MHKPDQSELLLNWSQLPYLEHLGLVQQEAAQPNIAKKAHRNELIKIWAYVAHLTRLNL